MNERVFSSFRLLLQLIFIWISRRRVGRVSSTYLNSLTYDLQLWSALIFMQNNWFLLLDLKQFYISLSWWKTPPIWVKQMIQCNKTLRSLAQKKAADEKEQKMRWEKLLRLQIACATTSAPRQEANDEKVPLHDHQTSSVCGDRPFMAKLTELSWSILLS